MNFRAKTQGLSQRNAVDTDVDATAAAVDQTEALAAL